MDGTVGIRRAKSRQRWLFYAYDRLRKTRRLSRTYSVNALWRRWALYEWLLPLTWDMDGTNGWPLYESRLKGKLHVISKRYTQRIQRHNLPRQHLALAGMEVAVVLKSVELHDKVIGHYLNIKHYQ
ncbi:IS1 family transposase [Klebsiella pneumoniae]|uniref:IS1 family transposase n=1 Tax=Klebsiella pneumoniae TaxID=573 RepID=UPI003AAF1A6E